jgi:hypothetical protein
MLAVLLANTFLFVSRAGLGRAAPLGTAVVSHVAMTHADQPPFGVPNLVPKKRRRPLAGTFVPGDEDGGIDFSDSSVFLATDNKPPSDGENTDDNIATEWSSRATKCKALWANETYRTRALAKRRQTIAHKGKTRPPKLARPPLSPAAQQRSDSMRLLRRDEEAWMRERLAAGADQRARLRDDGLKREMQRQRSEVAAKRHAARRAAAAAAASPVAETVADAEPGKPGPGAKE